MRSSRCINLYQPRFLAIKATLLLICFFWSIKSFSQLTITGFTPTSGPIGTPVTITGSNFSTTPANNIIYFGAVRGAVSTSTATSITVSVPIGATYLPVTLSTSGLIASTQSPFNVTFPGGLNSFVNSSFASKIDFATPTGPYSVIACDLDIDGKADCITANNSANSISVFRNISTGGTISFATRIDLAVGSNPRNVSFGDLDGDGMQDLIVSNAGSNTISIFRNTSTSGNISFALKVDINTPVTPGKTAIGDLNNDGKQDIAIACEFANAVRVLNNTSTPGSISFSIAADLSPGTQPNAVAIGDLDGDGKRDLSITRVPYVIAVYRNNSTGSTISFDPKTDIPIIGGTPRNILINDLDFDNKAEMIIVENTGDQIGVFKNTGSTGTISFAGIQHFQTGSYPDDVSIGDLNGDGKPDLVSANYNANNVSVLKNTFSGAGISFAAKIDYACGAGPYGVCLADIESDGKPDIITANATTNTISVLRNKVNEPAINSFTPVVGVTGTVVTITGNNFTGTTAVSFGGTLASSFTIVNDNTITAIVANGSSGNVSVTNAYATGLLSGFTFQTQLPPVISSFTPIAAVSGSNITISGSNFNSTAANNIVYFGSVKANVTAASSNSLTAVAPVSGTYHPITVSANNLTAYSILPFNRTFTGVVNAFTPLSYSEPLQFASGMGTHDIVMADIDGDGKSDAVVTVTITGSDRVFVFRNISTGGTISFAPAVDIAPFSGNPYKNISIVDLDGDGKLDVAISTSSNITLIKNTSTPGTISFAPVVQYSNSAGPFGISIADVDGDGKPDIAVTVPGNGAGNTVSVYRNTSSGGTISLAAKVDFTVGVNPRSLIANDFDTDGKTDLAAVNADAGTITVLRNISVPGAISFATATTLSANNNSEKLTAGDFDGDGKLDIAATNSGVYPAYNNTVCIFRNTSTVGNISFAPKIDLIGGTSTHDVAVSDLDGDGKPELVVSNYQSHTVSVFKNNSSTGSIAFASGVTYATGNWPMNLTLGDWDGDGYPEITYTNGLSTGFLILRSQVNIPVSSLVPPVITSLSPASGNINSSLTINGNNFSSTPANNTVYLGSVKATVTTATTTSLNVTVPMGASYKPVSVARDKLSGYSLKPFNVTFADGGSPFTSNFFKSKVDLPSITNPNGMASSDFDGDGKPDIAVSNASNVTIYRNIGTGTSVAFAPGINFAAGSNPEGVFVADINNDSKQDLVVASFGMSVLINTSTGPGNISFAIVQNLSAGWCNDIAIGDIDADGRPDIAYTYTSGTGVTVLRNLSNNGTVSFVRVNDYITENGECRVAMGDVTGDSKPDLVVTNHGSNSVSVLRNLSVSNGISFAAAVNFSVTNASECGLADIDNDGKLDMLVLGNSSSSPAVSVFRNTSSSGLISFASKVDFAAGRNPVNISISDLNGDTKPDVALINSYDSSVSALKNTSVTGAISFENKYDYRVGMEPMGIVTEDWNADSVADIATVNFISNTISILINDHNSPVISSINPVSGIVGTTVTISGFNFNSTTSVKFGGTNAASFTVVSSNTITAVTGEGSNGTVTVTTPLGTASYESFSFAPPIITSFSPLSAPVGATVTISGNNFSAVPANNIVYFGSVRGLVTASTTTSISVTVPAGASYYPITVTTHNMTAYSNKLFSLAYSTAPGPLTSSSFGTKIDLATAGYSPPSCVVKDFDGDGKPDLAAPSYYHDNITIFRNTTTGSSLSFASSTITGNFGNLWFINSGDFDGDGKPDLIISDYDFSELYVYRNISTIGNIIFAPAIIFNSGGSDPNCIAIDDLDGDGKPDLVVSHGFSDFYVLRNTSTVGNISFATPNIIAVSHTPVYVALADLDNDGKPDMITSNYTTLNVGILRNTSTPGNVSFTIAASVTLDGFPWALAVGDLNDDGKLDIAVSNDRLVGAPVITILQNISSGGSISVVRAGDLVVDGYQGVAIGDVNGDRKQDLIGEGYTGTSFVSVFRNIGTGGSISFDTRINYETDSGPGYVTTGDINLDGKTDIVTANRHGGLGGSLTILLNQMAIVTSVPVIPLSDLELQVFPNPFNESVILKAGKTLQDVQVQLVNVKGQVVYTGSHKIVQAGAIIEIKKPSLPAGLYVLKVTTDKAQSAIKLIKQ